MYHNDGKMLQTEAAAGLERFTVAPNKARKPNWTEIEVMLLLEEYSKRKHIMRPTFGTVVSMTERQKCWSEISDVINTSEGINGCYRSVKEVQKKWENLSNRMRSEYATLKVEPSFRLSDTSVALNNILNGDGKFDGHIFTKTYSVLKQERPDDECFGKDEDSRMSEETTEETHSSARQTAVPVLNIPFKANNRFQQSLESYVPVTPRANQIYSSLSNQTSPTLVTSNQTKRSRPRECPDHEFVFPSGDSVCVTSTQSGQTETITDQNQNNNFTPARDKPNSDTSAKLRKAMLKRVNSVNSSSDSGQSNKKTKLEKTCHCPVFSDKLVTKLYKQVLILKKRTLRQNLEKIDLEKERTKLETDKLRLETEKLKLETETAKMNKEKVTMELATVKQTFSALL